MYNFHSEWNSPFQWNTQALIEKHVNIKSAQRVTVSSPRRAVCLCPSLWSVQLCSETRTSVSEEEHVVDFKPAARHRLMRLTLLAALCCSPLIMHSYILYIKIFINVFVQPSYLPSTVKWLCLILTYTCMIVDGHLNWTAFGCNFDTSCQCNWKTL